MVGEGSGDVVDIVEDGDIKEAFDEDGNLEW